MKDRIHASVIMAAFALAGCAPAPTTAPEPPDTRAADEMAIRSLIKDWAAAAQAKDAEKFVSVYAPDATVILEDSPDFRGVDAVRDAITGMMKDPNFALSFEADNVVVARSGDMAYETGTYAMTMSDPAQKPAPENGHYVVVWRKQPDGAWKVVLDVPVSDPPAAAPATP